MAQRTLQVCANDISLDLLSMRSPGNAPPPLPDDWVEGYSKYLPIIQVINETESPSPEIRKDMKKPKLISRRKSSEVVEKEQPRKSPIRRFSSLPEDTNQHGTEERWRRLSTTPPRDRRNSSGASRRRPPNKQEGSRSRSKSIMNNTNDDRSSQSPPGSRSPVNSRSSSTSKSSNSISPCKARHNSNSPNRSRTRERGISLVRKMHSEDIQATPSRIGIRDPKALISKKHSSLFKTFSAKQLVRNAIPSMETVPPVTSSTTSVIPNGSAI